MSLSDDNSIGLMDLPELKDPTGAAFHANYQGEDYHVNMGSLFNSGIRQSIASSLNLKKSDVGIVDINTPVDGFSVLFDPVTEKIFWRSTSTGTPSSWSVSYDDDSMTLVTNKGTYTLGQIHMGEPIVERLNLLRQMEPVNGITSVKVRRAIKRGVVINAVYGYDSTDTTTADDGYRTIVTTGGKRWKLDISNGLNAGLGGLLANGSNLGTAVQTLINNENAKVIAAKNTFSVVSKIFIPAIGSTYTLDTGIKIPSYMQLKSPGNCHMKYTGDPTLSALTIANSGLTGIADGGMGSSNYVDIQGSTILDADGGSFYFHGPGSAQSGSAGITIGEFGTAYLSVRDLKLSNFRITGFKYGLVWGYKNNYINTISDFDIASCQIGVYYPYPKASAGNSGEKITYKNGTFGNFTTATFWISMWNVQMNIDNCSLDYTAKDVFYLDQYSAGTLIDVNQGWIEGWGNMLVNAPFSPTTGSGSTWIMKSAVSFNKVFFVPNQYNNPQYSGDNKFMHVRQMCSILKNGAGVIFDKCHWDINDKLLSKYWCLSGVGNSGTIDSDGTGGTNNIIVRNNPIDIQAGPVSFTNPKIQAGFLGDYLGGLMGWRYDFKYKGGSIVGVTDPGTRILGGLTNTSGTSTMVKSGGADTDGFSPITLTSGGATDVFTLQQTKLFDSESGLAWWYSVISAMRGSDFSGIIQVNTTIELLDDEVTTATLNSDNTITINKSRELMDAASMTPGPWFDSSPFFTNADKLNNGNYNDYLAIPTAVRQSAWASKIRVTISIKGFTGTILVKLPVFWKIDLGSSS